MEEETMNQSLEVLAVTDFGPGNKGTIGRKMAEPECRQLAAEASDEKYRRRPTNRWICVDKRLAKPEHRVPTAEGEADPQTAGGIIITDTAASFMADAGGPKLSERIPTYTKAALADGLRPVMHGDGHGAAGCGANKTLRSSLQSNGENIEVVVPLAQTVCAYLKIESWIDEPAIRQSVLTGQANAANDKLWDITPEEVTELAIANGAEYEELEGEHDEAITRVDVSDDAFDKSAFAADHTSAEDSVGAFVATLGALRNENFRRAKTHGQTEQDAALKTMRDVLFNIGVCKELSSEDMALVLLG